MNRSDRAQGGVGRDLQIVVVDEADRMADMGFPAAGRSGSLRNAKRVEQTLLFSATLDGVVDTLIKRYQHDPVMHEIESTSVTVEEMEHRFLQIHQMDKVKVTAAIARNASRTNGVRPAPSRGADRLAEQLGKEGVRALAIHGDLRQTAREKRWPTSPPGACPCWSRRRGRRGIHVDDVDIVVHYDPPEDHKAYLHRSGRTARPAQSGVVVTLVLGPGARGQAVMSASASDQPHRRVFSNDPRLADLGPGTPPTRAPSPDGGLEFDHGRHAGGAPRSVLESPPRAHARGSTVAAIDVAMALCWSRSRWPDTASSHMAALLTTFVLRASSSFVPHQR